MRSRFRKLSCRIGQPLATDSGLYGIPGIAQEELLDFLCFPLGLMVTDISRFGWDSFSAPDTPTLTPTLICETSPHRKAVCPVQSILTSESLYRIMKLLAPTAVTVPVNWCASFVSASAVAFGVSRRDHE